MRTDQFDYHLPPELIAQVPSERGESRLLVLHRSDGRLEHRQFSDLLDYLSQGDTLVLNDTRVTARRLVGVRESGREAEVLLLRRIGDKRWEALVRSGKSLRSGASMTILGRDRELQRATATVTGITSEGGRILEFADAEQSKAVGEWGVSPLPPYIHTPLPVEQEERYQTVYARHDGSAAAPTAGLHFTTEMITQAREKGISTTSVTLHVGADTFRPVRSDTVGEHEMHGEWIELRPDAAAIINSTPGRVACVGTTSTRCLESAAGFRTPSEQAAGLRVAAYQGDTHLFITPGYAFQAMDALITNFHLPRSTLLMLVSAFAGVEAVRHAYDEAVRLKYKFFSFGDAMLIL